MEIVTTTWYLANEFGIEEIRQTFTIGKSAGFFRIIEEVAKLADIETTRTKCIHLPDLNLREDGIRLPLAIKLLEGRPVSLGMAAEIAGFSERAFAEILLQRGVSPMKYTDIDLHKELENA